MNVACVHKPSRRRPISRLSFRRERINRRSPGTALNTATPVPRSPINDLCVESVAPPLPLPRPAAPSAAI